MDINSRAYACAWKLECVVLSCTPSHSRCRTFLLWSPSFATYYHQLETKEILTTGALARGHLSLPGSSSGTREVRCLGALQSSNHRDTMH